MKKKKVHWLKYSDLCYMRFEETDKGVHVKGPLGLSAYKDTVMSKEEARAYWEELVSHGYRKTDDPPSEHFHDAITYGR